MKGGAHPSAFAALSLLDLEKIPIYCFIDRFSYQQMEKPGLNLSLLATFYTITELL